MDMFESNLLINKQNTRISCHFDIQTGAASWWICEALATPSGSSACDVFKISSQNVQVGCR